MAVELVANIAFVLETSINDETKTLELEMIGPDVPGLQCKSIQVSEKIVKVYVGYVPEYVEYIAFEQESGVVEYFGANSLGKSVVWEFSDSNELIGLYGQTMADLRIGSVGAIVYNAYDCTYTTLNIKEMEELMLEKGTDAEGE